MKRTRPIVLAIVVVLSLSGCGFFSELVESATEDTSTTTTEAPDDSEPKENNDVDVDLDVDADLEDLIEEAEDEIDGEDEPTLSAPEVTFREVDGASEEVIEHIGYVEAFWTEAGAELGFDYEPVNADRLIPRSILVDGEGEVCSNRRVEELLDPDAAEYNAYVTLCDEGVTMVWDDILYEPDLEERFPGAGMAMLIAHEWGHVIQAQLGTWFTLNPLISEQQADCFAGAYAQWAEERGIEPFSDPQSLDFAIISTLETRDPVGSDPNDPYAHGNGFDRVRATQEGYEGGAVFCDAYEDTPPPITQEQFGTAEDRQNEGNLPYEEALDLIVPAVETYFESLSDEPLQPFVDEPDDRTLLQLHGSIGDLAIGAEYALRYGGAVQEANGDAVTGVGPALQRACLMGSFLGDAYDNGLRDESGEIIGSLSPGDLDEAILTLSTSDELLANPGVVFEMVSAMRVGTLEGVDACALA